MSRLSSTRRALLKRHTELSAQHQQSFGLVEPLESRLMLATYVVNSTMDDNVGVVDGQLTLREAIIAAETNTSFGDAVAGDADGDEILFSAALANMTISLDHGEFFISDDLLIDGESQNVRIDGQGLSRIFQIDTDETVQIASLQINSGRALSEGGAMWIGGSGSVTIDTVSFSNHVANGNGGGVIYTEIASLTIRSSTLSNGTADGPSGAGGGLYVAAGDVLVEDSTFTLNVANRSGGGIEVISGSLALDGTNFIANVAGPSGSASPGNGGALHVAGLGVNVTVSGGIVQSNEAAQEGGGFWNQLGSTMVVRDNTSFSSNRAKGAAADDGGGALFNNGGTLRVFDATLSNNRAMGSSGSGGAILTAGGILNVRNSVITGNDAIRAGGGIEVFEGYAKLQNVRLGGPDNPDKNTAGRNGTGNPGNGGGLHVSGGIGTTVVIVGGSIQKNEAFTSGGGVWNSGAASMYIQNGTQILDNKAFGVNVGQGGGGIFNDGGLLSISSASIINNEATGPIASGGGIIHNGGDLIVSNSTISGNKAQRSGGGVQVNLGNVSVTSSSVSSNQAGYNFGANPGNGGGIHVAGAASVKLTNSTVSNNVADKQGGGVWNQVGSTLIVRNSSLSSNTARGSVFGDGGGGIFSAGGTVRLIDAGVVGNSANGLNGQGGGVLIVSGILNVRDDSVIASNSAVLSGGGVEFVNGYMRIDDSVIGGDQASEGNTLSNTSGDGAGIHNSGINASNYMLLNNVAVQNNVAPRSGGGLWVQSGTTVSVRGTSEFSNNAANGSTPSNGGGGIFNNGGEVRLFGTTIADNQATGPLGSGGGIFSRGGVLNIRDNSVIRGNTASNFGGGIEIVFGYAQITSSVIGGDPLSDVNQAKYGGAIHVSGTSATTVVLDNTLVTQNKATISGGGLWNQNGAFMLLRNGTVVSFNVAEGIGTPQGGGGIFNQSGGMLEIQGSRVSNNIADGLMGHGGGVYAASGSFVTLVGATINGNSTRANGGGIYNAGTVIGNATSTVFANLALEDGGGIFVTVTGTNVLNGMSVTSNNPNNIVFA